MKQRHLKLNGSKPLTRQIRLAGILAQYSARMFSVELDNGNRVRGMADRDEIMEQLSRFLNKRIVVVGKAVYRASGSIRCVAVEHVEEDSGESGLFSRIPLPLDRKPSI